MATDLKAGAISIDIKGNIAGLTESLKSANKRLRAFSQGIVAVGKKTMMVGGVITGALLGVGKLFAAAGDKSAKAARRIGIGVEAIEELGYAAELAGANMGSVEKAIDRMMKSIGEAKQGLAKPTTALKALGVTLEDLSKLNVEDKFIQIAEAVREMNKVDPAKANAFLKDIFGRSGTQLLPMFMSDMKAARLEANELGIVFSTKAAAKAEILTDAFFKLGQVSKYLVYWMGEKLAKAIYKDITYMLQLSKVAMKAVKSEFFGNLINDAFKFGKILIYVGGTMVAFGTSLKLLSVAFGLLLSPTALFVGMLVAGAVAALWYSEKLGYLSTNVFGFVSSLKVAGITLSSWGSAAFEGLATAAAIMWKILKSVFASIVMSFANMVENLLELGADLKLGDIFSKALLNVEWGVEHLKLTFGSLFEFVVSGFKKIAMSMLDFADTLIDTSTNPIFGISERQAKEAHRNIAKIKKDLMGMMSIEGKENTGYFNVIEKLKSARGAQTKLEDTSGLGMQALPGRAKDLENKVVDVLLAGLESGSAEIREKSKDLFIKYRSLAAPEGNKLKDILNPTKPFSEFNQGAGNLLDELEMILPKTGRIDYFDNMKSNAISNIKDIEAELDILNKEGGKSSDFTGSMDGIQRWADEMSKSSEGVTETFKEGMAEIKQILNPEFQPLIDGEGQAKDFVDSMKAAIAKVKKYIEEGIGLQTPMDDFDKQFKATVKSLHDAVGKGGIFNQSGIKEKEKLGDFSSFQSTRSFEQLFGEMGTIEDEYSKQQIDELKKHTLILKESLAATKKITVGAGK